MKLTKKLFIAIMTMALLVVTFSASTFAWFTLGQESKIDTVKVNVMAGAGMEISLDGTTWKNNISVADLLNSNEKDLSDITSSDGKTFKKIVNGEYDNATTDNYLTLTLYVRVTTTDGAVDFDGVMLKEVKGSDRDFSVAANKWTADETFTGKDNLDADKAYTFGEAYNFDALNAVKISFEDTDSNILLFGYENTNNQGDVSLTGTAKAYAVAKSYNVPNKFADETPTVPTYMKKADLDAAVAEADTADAKKLAVTVIDDAAFINTDLDTKVFDGLSSFDSNKLDTTNYKYAKLTVRIWIEGWDADCINAILDQNTSFNFTLQAWKKQQA